MTESKAAKLGRIATLSAMAEARWAATHAKHHPKLCTALVNSVIARRCGGASLCHILDEQFAQFRPLFEPHVHNFKGDVLRSAVSHQYGGLNIAQPDLYPQLDRRARSEAHTNRRQPSRQTGGLDLQTAILLQVGGHRRHSLGQ